MISRTDIRYEIVPYADAPWAPGHGVGDFTWAWRVVGARGNTVTGASNGSRKWAVATARRVVARMRKASVGQGNPRAYVVSGNSRSRPVRR